MESRNQANFNRGGVAQAHQFLRFSREDYYCFGKIKAYNEIALTLYWHKAPLQKQIRAISTNKTIAKASYGNESFIGKEIINL
jgi:hypothetical protein